MALTVTEKSPPWLRFIDRDDMAPVFWFMGAIFFILWGTTEGLIMVIQFVWPDFLAGIPALVLGRVRQSHTNSVMFGILSMGQIGMWYFMTPRLTARKLWSQWMGSITAVLWGLAVFIGVAGELAGYSQGREYAEMTYGVDVAIPAGGGIDWTCSFDYQCPDGASLCGDPTQNNCFTFGGHVDAQEHCNAFVYYWPKVTDISCF